MKLSGVHHVAVVTANFAEKKRFYTEVLELEVVGKFAGKDIIFLKTGSITIELVSRETHVAGTSGGWDHFAFEVEDIEAELARLKNAGFTLIHESPKDGADNKRIAFLHPKSTNGLLVELCQEK